MFKSETVWNRSWGAPVMTISNGCSRGRASLSAILALLAVLLCAPAGWASDARSSTGPAVGTALAETLVFKDQTGASRDFSSLTGESGLVLVFSRSLSWCPFCIADARDWATRVDAAAAKGVNIAIATYDDPDTLAGFAKRFGARITLLSDTGSKVINALGILNEEHAPGSFAHGIPHPIVFVIDAKGVVRSRFSETSYAQRPDKERVLGAAFALGGN